MRINVYSQELTEEVEMIRKEGTNAEGSPETFYGVRMLLHSTPNLHYIPGVDDDRSAITLWLPKSDQRRLMLARTLRRMADLVEYASVIH